MNHSNHLPRWTQVVAWVLVASFLLLATGCGNSGDGPGGPTGLAPTNNFFMGRVFLEEATSDTSVTIKDLSGRALYQLTSNDLGIFWARGPLPLDFRIEVLRPGDPVIYAREIRGGYFGGTMYINPATTLVSRHMQAHGTSLQEAEAAVKTLLEIPQDFELNWITNSPTSPFAPRRFFEEAAQNGGVEAFLQLLLEEVPNRKLSLVESDESSAFTSVLKEVGSDIFGDTVSLVDAGIFGAVTQALGLNIGTAGALNEIEADLNDVLLDLGQIEKDLNLESLTGTYNADRTAMAPAVTSILLYTGNISRALGGTYAVSDLEQDILGIVATQEAKANLALLYEYLLGLGVDNIIFTYGKIQQANMFSDIDSSYLSYPFRRNAVTSSMQKQLRNWENVLALGVNLFAESAHVRIPITDALTDAVTDIDQTNAVLQQMRAQVPASLPSDEVAVDMEGGVMWYLSFQAQEEYDDAVDLANNFSVGPYDDWELPGRGDLERLVLDLVGGQVTDDDSNDQWRAAFQSFGFDTTHYGEHDGPTTLGLAYYNEDTGGTTLSTNSLVWQGVVSNPATQSYPKSTYILKRVLQGTPEQELRGGINPLAYGQIAAETTSGGPSLQVSHDSGQLTARTTIYSYFEFLSIEFVTTILGNAPYDVTQYCHWESSNLKMATVSNVPTTPDGVPPAIGPIGQIAWHPPVDGSPLSPVTFTASFWGMPVDGGGGLLKLQAGVTVDPPQNLTPNQTSLQVLPAQNSVDATTAPSTGTAIIYYATAFYEDGQFHSVEGDCQWTLTNSMGNALVSEAAGGGFITSTPNELKIYDTLTDSDLTVTAVYTNPLGQQISTSVPLSATINTP